MSKKISKILGGLAAAGAVAAGIFYLYKKNNSEDDFEDEFNEDFEAEEFELDEDLKEVSDRGYTTLTPAPESEAKEEPCADDCGQEDASSEDAAPAANIPETEDEPKAE